MVAAEIEKIDGTMAKVRIGPLERHLPLHGLRPGPAHVALRPERIELHSARRPDTIEGEVLKATCLGSHFEYTVATALGELFVIDGKVERLMAPGSQVSVGFDASGLSLVRS